MPASLLHWLGRRPAADAWPAWIEADNRRPVSLPAGPLDVVHYIGALYCGGAERQLCNLALGQQAGGHRVRVRTTYPLDGDLGHYRGLLQTGGLTARPARAPRFPSWPRKFHRRRLDQVPAAIRDAVYQLSAELAGARTDVLHCWLDLANVIGGLAGLLAGVPRIILGLRMSNPTHFPRFQHDFLLPCYRWLKESRRVRFLANSASAAASHADWLDIPAGSIPVVLNGLDASQFPAPTAAARLAARQSFGLGPEHRVVAGVFRLFEEKQPDLFLRVVRQARPRVPGLRVLLAGVGPLEAGLRAALAAPELDHVRLLGRVEDVGRVHLASDVSLLTSSLDSCPNTVMEAQHLGVPVVATAAGGIPELVRDGLTGLLADIHDADRLSDHLVLLLNDDDLRQRFAWAARACALERFNLERMIDRTLAAYAAA